MARLRVFAEHGVDPEAFVSRVPGRLRGGPHHPFPESLFSRPISARPRRDRTLFFHRAGHHHGGLPCGADSRATVHPRAGYRRYRTSVDSILPASRAGRPFVDRLAGFLDAWCSHEYEPASVQCVRYGNRAGRSADRDQLIPYVLVESGMDDHHISGRVADRAARICDEHVPDDGPLSAGRIALLDFLQRAARCRSGIVLRDLSAILGNWGRRPISRPRTTTLSQAHLFERAAYFKETL